MQQLIGRIATAFTRVWLATESVLAPQPNIQRQRSAGADELVQHRRRDEEAAEEVQQRTGGGALVLPVALSAH